MDKIVHFKYGTWERFQNCEKDDDTLYVLDNSQLYKGTELLTNVKTVSSSESYLGSTDDAGFPDIITPEMRENYYISLTSGKIKFVTDELEYIDVTELQLNDLLINQNFLQKLIAAIADTTNIIMPTLTVDGQKLIWTESNVNNVTVFTPKQ